MSGNQRISITISPLSSKPIYAQIEEQVRTAILSGSLEQDAELPSIRSLAQSLRISVITTRRAYDDLEREGYLRTTPGKGSYARRPDSENMLRERQEALRRAFGPAVEEAIALGFGAEEIMTIVQGLFEARGEEHRDVQ
ncbi:MAG: GntR family transcriptional regulator [Spirochaetes bacterium]|nr:GntR family transcriptional regulator [Spirochaetota bacterium]